MRFKVDWTDEEHPDGDVSLPKVVEVPDDVDLDDVADWLSDRYGFLVIGAVEVKRWLVREFRTNVKEYEVEASSREEARDRVTYEELEPVSEVDNYDGMEIEEVK